LVDAEDTLQFPETERPHPARAPSTFEAGGDRARGTVQAETDIQPRRDLGRLPLAEERVDNGIPPAQSIADTARSGRTFRSSEDGVGELCAIPT
jgi:hypothetical protein